MRKSYLIILTLVSLLFVGCLGGSSPKDDYVYDGSPTILEVVVKRDVATTTSLFSHAEEEPRVKVYISKVNDAGEIIYGVTKEIPVSQISANGYKISEEVPAEKGYRAVAYYSDSCGHFEVSEQFGVNAPAEVITTADLNLTPIEYEVVVPEVMYSGGSMAQFKLIFPPEYEHLFRYGVFYSSHPFETNGMSRETYPLYSTPTSPKYLPNVRIPRTYYYQFRIIFAENASPSFIPYSHLPNLEKGEELGTFSVYPSP